MAHLFSYRIHQRVLLFWYSNACLYSRDKCFLSNFVQRTMQAGTGAIGRLLRFFLCLTARRTDTSSEWFRFLLHCRGNIFRSNIRTSYFVRGGKYHIWFQKVNQADRPKRHAKVVVYDHIVPRVGAAVNSSTYDRVRTHRTYESTDRAIYGLTHCETEECLKLLKTALRS